MDEELKPCPFCGQDHKSYSYWNIVGYDERGNPIKGEKKEYVDFYADSDEKSTVYISPETWNTRPIEDELRAEIASLKAELAAEREKNRWIPVGDRLPEVGVKVNVLYRGGKRVETGMIKWLTDIYDDGTVKFVVFETGNTIHFTSRQSITHWMPLPVPPEVE